MKNTITQNKPQFNAVQICITALFTAIVCVATMIVEIPIPLGYAHMGDSMILLSTYLLGPFLGMFCAGIGSAMADLLTGYAVWALPTLIIKSLMPWVAYAFFKNKNFLFKVIGSVASLLVMTAGYVIAGSLIYGSVAVGLTQTPGLLLKSVVNLVVFILLWPAMDKIKKTIFK